MNSKVLRAAEFAILAHGDQKYGDEPYSYHLEKVYRNAVKFGGSEIHQMVAWLHDVIEDTTMDRARIQRSFGGQIATIVELLSNTNSKEETFKRIRTDKDAVFVKLCDRLANVSEGQKNDKYRKEHELFKSILFKEGEFDALWKAIDEKLSLN